MEINLFGAIFYTPNDAEFQGDLFSTDNGRIFCTVSSLQDIFQKRAFRADHSSACHRRFVKDLRHVATDRTRAAALNALLSFPRVRRLLLYATHSKYPHRKQSGGSEVLGGDRPAVGGCCGNDRTILEIKNRCVSVMQRRCAVTFAAQWLHQDVLVLHTAAATTN